ncbi:MAG: hypothetical protein AAF591_15370 [Verrucomicrobiota bacterium]
MENYRDNPSEAEKRQDLTRGRRRKYRVLFWVGLVGLLIDVVLIVLLCLGVIPTVGVTTILVVGYILVSTGPFVVMLLVGQGKGQDHRPTIGQMLGGGGRR